MNRYEKYIINVENLAYYTGYTEQSYMGHMTHYKTQQYPPRNHMTEKYCTLKCLFI